MITRISINGFKSLVNVEVFLGTFTCIAGRNAVGKSNLFDALVFLSNLADKPLLEAAKLVRSEGQKHTNIRDIFQKIGNNYTDTISFEIDMIVPSSTTDDLGQKAEATITSLRYSLELYFNDIENEDPIKIKKEELVPIPLLEARKSIKFPHTKEWLKSCILGRRTTSFISTQGEIIKIHQDDRKGRTADFVASKMPRTLLSTVTAEYSTAFCVRHELRSWKMLQLEPSALRQPDDFDKRKNAKLKSNGENLPATLYRLHNENKETDRDIYQELTNNLTEILDGIDLVDIDKDEKRELLTLRVHFKDGSTFPANSLSDGTLRFLGLSVLELDTNTDGIICFEEPENGIHPSKIASIIDLLQKIATDTNYEVGDDNPLRQVIINTHSPIVVSVVPEDSLLMAESLEEYNSIFEKKYIRTNYASLDNTWRKDIPNQRTTNKATILSYLNPIESIDPELLLVNKPKAKRVIDRDDINENIGQMKIGF